MHVDDAVPQDTMEGSSEPSGTTASGGVAGAQAKLVDMRNELVRSTKELNLPEQDRSTLLFMTPLAETPPAENSALTEVCLCLYRSINVTDRTSIVYSLDPAARYSSP